MDYDPATDANVTVVWTFPKAHDQETHVLLVDLPNGQVLEFRDYMPSLLRYGRGYWLPVDALEDLKAALENIEPPQAVRPRPKAAGRAR